MSGLKINFHKSEIFIFDVEMEEQIRVANQVGDRGKEEEATQSSWREMQFNASLRFIGTGRGFTRMRIHGLLKRVIRPRDGQ